MRETMNYQNFLSLRLISAALMKERATEVFHLLQFF